MAPDNFNLDKAGRAAAVRPATFYYLCGVTPWASLFEDCKFERRDAPIGAPAGSATLVATSKNGAPHEIEVHILLDERGGLLHGYESFERGKPISQLSIAALARNPDGRVFPSRATYTINDPQSGRPFQVEVLAAIKVTFPSTKAELDAAFAMSLPKGVRIYDRVLNHKITLSRPTPVKDILSGNLPGTDVENARLND